MLPLVGCAKAGTTEPPTVVLGHGQPHGRRRDHPATEIPEQAPADRFHALRGFCDGIDAPDAAEYAAHVEHAQRQLRERKLAALVVEPGPTMGYFSGVRWGTSERPFLLVIPREGRPAWVCPSFEAGTAQERVGERADLRLWHEHESPYARAAEVVREHSEGRGRVAVDAGMRQFIVAGLEDAFGKRRVVVGGDVVVACRIKKDERELARLRRANEATKAALRTVAPLAEPGMEQSDFAAVVREALLTTGLTRPWVLCLFGPNAAYPHGTKEGRRLRPGDLILVDTGGSLHGYSSDITRTWPFGEPDDEQRKAWATVREAQLAGFEHIKPGKRCSEADAAAREVMTKAGYPGDYGVFTHRLGHGIGLQGHEEPYLRRGNQRVLEPGMTMSNEPGIYIRGRLGMRLEDIVAVTEDGHEIFGPLAKSIDEPFG